MNTSDYVAFMESQLRDNPDIPFFERVAIEEELIEYYHTLAVLEEQLQDETLSDDERERAWYEYQELCQQV